MRAEDEAREAIRRKPDSADAHATLSDVLMMRDEPEQSLLSLREAIRLAPGAVNYHFAHVSQLLRRGDLPEAEKALQAMQAAHGIGAELAIVPGQIQARAIG